jgi:hypothetical protein
MKKGFNPTPKPEKKIKNLREELSKTTSKFKRLLKNPLIVASTLDKHQTDGVE